jgi:hypothetical protein
MGFWIGILLGVALLVTSTLLYREWRHWGSPLILGGQPNYVQRDARIESNRSSSRLLLSKLPDCWAFIPAYQAAVRPPCPSLLNVARVPRSKKI